MIVISRRKNEGLVIDNVVRVFVVEIRGDKVRLGIECPKEYSVHRSEIHDVLQPSVHELQTSFKATLEQPTASPAGGGPASRAVSFSHAPAVEAASRLAEARHRLTQLQQELTACETRRNDVERNLDVLRHELVDLRARYRQLKREVRAQQQQVTRLEETTGG